MNRNTIVLGISLAWGIILYLKLDKLVDNVEAVYIETTTKIKNESPFAGNALDSLVMIHEQYNIKYPLAVISQSILETRYWSSRVSQENKNNYGMKRSDRSFLLNPRGKKKPRDCDCFDWQLHACYDSYQSGLKDFAAWQQLILSGYESKFKRLPNSDEEYIAMLDTLWFPGAKRSKRYASDPDYTEKVLWILHHKVLPLTTLVEE